MIDWRINRISPGSNSNGCACGFSVVEDDSPTIFQEDISNIGLSNSIAMAKKFDRKSIPWAMEP